MADTPSLAERLEQEAESECTHSGMYRVALKAIAELRRLEGERAAQSDLLDSSALRIRELESDADEYDRLHEGACLRYREAGRNDRQPEIDALRAENARLREALESAESALREWRKLHFNDDGTNYIDLSNEAQEHFAKHSNALAPAKGGEETK